MRQAERIIEDAAMMQTASQSFDTAIEGFGYLVAAGDHEGADRLLDETFKQWATMVAEDPEWVLSYAER